MKNEKSIIKFKEVIWNEYLDDKITKSQLDNSYDFLSEVIKKGYTTFDISNLLDLYLKGILNK
jgi:hypothetical protein